MAAIAAAAAGCMTPSPQPQSRRKCGWRVIEGLVSEVINQPHCREARGVKNKPVKQKKTNRRVALFVMAPAAPVLSNGDISANGNNGFVILAETKGDDPKSSHLSGAGVVTRYSAHKRGVRLRGDAVGDKSGALAVEGVAI